MLPEEDDIAHRAFAFRDEVDGETSRLCPASGALAQWQSSGLFLILPLQTLCSAGRRMPRPSDTASIRHCKTGQSCPAGPPEGDKMPDVTLPSDDLDAQ